MIRAVIRAVIRVVILKYYIMYSILLDKEVCPKPKISGNVTVKYIKFQPNLISKVGSKLKFDCEKGYTLVGHKKLRCQRDGNWSASFPVCRGKYFLTSILS